MTNNKLPWQVEVAFMLVSTILASQEWCLIVHQPVIKKLRRLSCYSFRRLKRQFPLVSQRPEPEKLILQVFGKEVRSPRLPIFRSNCNKFYWMLPFCLAKTIDGLHLFTMAWPTSRLVVRAMTAIAAMSDSDTRALCASGYVIQSL